MQGITLALSLEGIKQLVEGMCAPASYLEKAINNTSLNDYSITDDSLGEAWIGIDGSNAEDCTQIHVYLSQGAISNFTMSASDPTVHQQANGAFLLSFSSGAAFNAKYTWNENWSQQNQYWEDNSNGDGGEWVPQGSSYEKQAGPFNFSLGVGSLATTATFTFTYDSNSQTWQLPVSTVTTSPNNPTPNIPAGSVLQHSTTQCNGQIHLEQGALDSLDKGDAFHSALTNGVFSHPLATIPASGQLTPDITFAFGLGGSPLTFPNDQGLTVGVTGISTYKGQTYSGTPPTRLPIPAVPRDGHHLQMYVSDYVINGLYWAFANAGLLTETVTPQLLESLHLDPTVLNVQTYIEAIPNIPLYQNLLNDLSDYSSDSMYADISPQKNSNNQPIPPTVEFGTVYIFNSNTMNALQSQMPDVYKVIQPTAINGQAYATKEALEDDLNNLNKKKIQIAPSLFPQIEQIVQELALVVTHNVQIKCTVQDSATPPDQLPYFTCTMSRYDILTELKLGVSASGTTQTLQFTHTECKPEPVFTMGTSNFITDNNDLQFFIVALTQGGEPAYDKLLEQLGSTGAPIPIMQGFKFIFEEALVNLEQGYIGILANVEFAS